MLSFARATDMVARACGHPLAVLASVLLVGVWAALGPYYGWSEEHQLVINTATTIITFWLVFIIQATQNRDGLAVQTKLDILIKAIPEAPNTFMRIEEQTEAEILALRDE